MSEPRFGKYSGKVEKNFDELGMGRLEVSVPAVLGDGRAKWAMPSVPYAGKGVGLFAIPPVGANVWVEFEGGDIEHPIWSGCFWGPGEAPQPALTDIKRLVTDGVKLELNDLKGAGGVTLEVGPPVVATPLKLVFDASGIAISNGAKSIKLSPASVSVNDGALEVL